MNRRGRWLLVALFLAGAAAAQAAREGPQAQTALLRDLESRYAQCMEAARRGDQTTYWRLRTAASRTRQPALDTGRIRLLADLLPPLESLEFVRLDANVKTARTLYRWRTPDVVQYSVIVYRMERGEWKLDDVSVRRSVTQAATAPAAALPGRPAAAPGQIDAPGGAALDADARAFLRAWESGRPDPSRSLMAPRL